MQWGRLYYESEYSVQGDHYVEFNNGVPTQVRQFNTPDDFEERRQGARHLPAGLLVDATA